jgi:hypothetical protein
MAEMDDELMKRLDRFDELVDATREAATADQLAAGRLDALVEQINVIAGLLEEWQSQGLAPEDQEKLRTRLDTIGEALERIAETTENLPPSQQPRKVPAGVYRNAEVLAEKMRLRAPEGDAPERVPGHRIRTRLRGSDPVGRLMARNGNVSFEPLPKAKFHPNDTVAIYGSGLAHVSKIRLGGTTVDLEDEDTTRTPDYIFFRVPKNVQRGARTRLEFELDGNPEPGWTQEVEVV